MGLIPDFSAHGDNASLGQCPAQESPLQDSDLGAAHVDHEPASPDKYGEDREPHSDYHPVFVGHIVASCLM